MVPMMHIVFLQVYILNLVGSNSCSQKDKRIEALEAKWMLNTKQYLCVSRCKLNLQKVSSKRQPNLFQRVHAVARKNIDCLKKSNKRSVHETCWKKVGDIQFEHLQDLPLYYFNSILMLSRFEAEKYCSRLHLNFGLPQNLLEKFLQNLPNQYGIWSQDLLLSNSPSRVDCYNNSLPEGVLSQKVINCKEKSNFVCSLPENCHAEVCESRCAPMGIDLCAPLPETTTLPEDCYPNCKAIAGCKDEEAEKFGYTKTSEGEYYKFCDRSIFISKASTFTAKGAQTLCCVKHMQLLSLETLHKKHCIAKELERLKLSSTQYWTSGLSNKCQNSFGWCGSSSEKEFVNFDDLQTEKLSSSEGRECIAADLVRSGNKSDLILSSEACKARKRVICERDPPQTCKDSKCLVLNCTKEIQIMKTAATMKYAGGVEFPGCNRLLRAELKTKVNYYSAIKFACATDCPVMSFENSYKVNCAIRAYLNNSALNEGSYWVSGQSIGCPSVHKWCNMADNPILDVQSPHITWKKGEPSPDPLKECVAVEFSRSPPHLTFFKEDCTKMLNHLAENLK